MMRANKPLLGFGPAGWALLAVAIALALVLITGYDLRFRIMKLICDTLGPQAVYDFVVYVIIFHGFNSCSAPPGVEFGLISLCVLLVAMQVDPRRMGVTRWVIAFALGIATPPLIAYAEKSLRGAPFLAGGGGLGWGELYAFFGILTSVIVAWIMRSWIVLGGMIALFAGGTTIVWKVYGAAPGTGWANNLAAMAFMWAWNPLLFALLMFIAVRARLDAWPTHACQSCGYDLRGIKTGVCPECGAEARAHTEPIAAALVGADPLPSGHE